MNTEQKSCYISLLGPTNAGKSTLINQIIGSRVSIVTPKVQTTRNQIRAILTEESTQLVFIDAPGIFRAKRAIDKFMIRQAWSAIHNTNVVMLLFDVKKYRTGYLSHIIKNIQIFSPPHVILIVNKIDLIEKAQLLPLLTEFKELYNFKEIFLISALKNDGVQQLTDYLKKQATISGWDYDKDQITDISSSMLAKEVTRKHLLLFLAAELPYELTVEQESWKENEESITIHQVIYVSQERHRRIIIGKHAQLLKEIGSKARKEMSYLLDKKVSLFLFVKVFERWEEEFISGAQI